MEDFGFKVTIAIIAIVAIFLVVQFSILIANDGKQQVQCAQQTKGDK